MASLEQSSEHARQEQAARLLVDTIPTLAWSARSDGSADFFNQRWLDYTGLSAEQACDWGWTVAVHPDDLNALVDYWRSVLASGEPGEIEGRLRQFDGVYRWFLFRAIPSLDSAARIVKWFGTNTDIEDRKRAELLLSGQNLVLEMIAKGNSLESILESLCRVVEQTASGCRCSVMLIDPSARSHQASSQRVSRAMKRHSSRRLLRKAREKFPGQVVRLPSSGFRRQHWILKSNSST